MITAPALPDDELVARARAGHRNAFAVLYHRHVQRVHGMAAAGSADAVTAQTITVGAFCDLLRHLHEVEPSRVGSTLDAYATRRLRGHRPAVRPAPLTVGVIDAMWRELDRRWPDGEPPRRDVGSIVPVTAGALVAVLVLAALASTSRRGGVPDPSRSFEAVAVQTDAPTLFPALPRPADTVSASEAETPAPFPSETTPATAVEPSPAPTSEAPVEPAEPPPTETSTEAPDAAPTVEIVSPANGSTLSTDGEDERGAFATVALEALVADDRDPPETVAVSWTSSLDGALAVGASATARLYVPDGQLTASHAVTVTATDAAGNTATDTVTVLVTRV